MQAAMQEVAHPDALAQPANADSNDQCKQKLLERFMLQHVALHNSRQTLQYSLCCKA